MARYTSQVTIDFNSDKEYRGLVPDTGTSVAVEVWSGTAWVVDPLSPVTSPTPIFTQGLSIRLTPTGGGFYLDEEARYERSR